MDGTEILVSSGIVLDINGFATLEELFPEEGGGTQQEQLAAEDNQSTMTNSITTTTTPSPSLSQEEEATMAQQEEQVGEIPPTPFPFLDSFTLTFNEPGTYDYFCAFHPGMFGQVIVGGSGGGEERQTNQTSTTI
jgi:hypothetical protein